MPKNHPFHLKELDGCKGQVTLHAGAWTRRPATSMKRRTTRMALVNLSLVWVAPIWRLATSTTKPLWTMAAAFILNSFVLTVRAIALPTTTWMACAIVWNSLGARTPSLATSTPFTRTMQAIATMLRSSTTAMEIASATSTGMAHAMSWKSLDAPMTPSAISILKPLKMMDLAARTIKSTTPVKERFKSLAA